MDILVEMLNKKCCTRGVLHNGEIIREVLDYRKVPWTVDAVLSNQTDIRIEKLAAVTEWNNFGHAESPASLLALTQAIYQQNPRALGIFIPAINCEFGEELSTITQKGLTNAIKTIRKIITSEDLTEYQKQDFDNLPADNFQE